MLVLLACTGDTHDSAGPVDDTAAPVPSLADADASWAGAPSTGAGSAVAGPGDLDGDGAEDVVVAAFYGNVACAHPYAPGPHALTDGVCVTGVNPYDFFGYSLAELGDVDGDGLADVAVGAIGSDAAASEAGQVYLLPGPWSAGTAAAATSSWTGQLGGDLAGISLSSAGDVDGDGATDLLIGAPGSDAGGAGSGRVFLVKGPFTAGVSSLSDAWASYTGETTIPAAFGHGSVDGGDALGDAVVGLGDLDGDGLDDIALGGGGADEGGSDAGVVWIVRGPSSPGDHRMADADARLTGPGASSYLGAALAGPGDLDGDGLADLVVAADGWEGGRVYVVTGAALAGVAPVEDAFATLTGATSGDVAGWAVDGAGDTDGDGQREVWIGAPGLDGAGEDAGGVYLVRDPAVPGVRALDAVGLRLDAEAEGDAAGRAVSGAGDVDGDGRDDLLAGALYNQGAGVFSGKAYLILGE